MTSSERLAEIQARREKITRSPWHIEMHYDDVIDEHQPIICAPNPVGTPRNGIAEVFFGDRVWDDAEFIAAAPSDIDFLLAALAAAESEAERLRRENEELGAMRAMQPEHGWFAARWRTTTGRLIGRAPDRMEDHACGCITGWDGVHEQCVLRRCADHDFDAASTDPDPEHFPWHYTEYGVICACGAAMRNEVCLASAVPGMPQPTEEERP